jgi:hypothetical protein
MWTLTAEDLRVARTRASERRRAIEEEMKALDAELADLDDIEQSISTFITKYRPDSPADAVASDPDKYTSSGEPVPPSQLAATPDVQLRVQAEPQINKNWGNLHFKPAVRIT